MAKSEIARSEFESIIDNISKELGLIKSETSSCYKIQGPQNKHRIYVFKSKFLGRIDATLPLSADDPAFKEPVSDLGSITCRIIPTREQLERALKMLANNEIESQVINKPKPFAASKAPAARRPKQTDSAVEINDSVPEPVGDDGLTLGERLKSISDRTRIARINRIIEEHGVQYADAEAVVDKRISLDEILSAVHSQNASEVSDFVAETGIDVN